MHLIFARLKNQASQLLLIPALVSVLAICGCPGAGGETSHGSLSHDNLTRTYRLFVPQSLSKRTSVPLVVCLHGGGGTGDKMARFTHFDDVARQEGFVVVYPDAFENHWNDGRKGVAYSSIEQNVDDVGFITALIATLESQYSIDSSRVYVTGASNGGMMTYHMLCEMTSLFAAGAPVIANMPSDLTPLCSPSASIPMIIINGEDDPLMPWSGGDIAADLPKRNKAFRGTVDSTDATFLYWSTHDQCQNTGSKTYLPDTDPNDGTRVWYKANTGGTDGSEVILYGVEGGGHTWPGGSQYLPQSLVGKVSHDIEATQLIWDFFKSHARG